MENILRTNKNASVLAKTWSQWTKDVQSSSRDLSQQISLLDLEAEANGNFFWFVNVLKKFIHIAGAESVEKHWLARTEVKKLTYADAEKLWISVVPLYQKLRQFLATHIATKFGAQVFTDPKLIPVHLLGEFSVPDSTQFLIFGRFS